MNLEAIQTLFANTHVFWDWSYLWNAFGMPAQAPIEEEGPTMCALMHGMTCTNELNPNPVYLP